MREKYSAVGFGFLLAAGWMGGSPVAHGQLFLDFQPIGGTTAAGYRAFEVANQANPPMSSQTFSAFGTNVMVDMTTANLPDGNLDFRAVTRNGAAGEVYNDWIGADTRNAGIDVTLTLQLTGLPSGSYTWLSYHEDGGTGETNGNLIGQADYTFTDFSGIRTGVIFFNNPSDNPVISTFSTSFTSNGVDPVTFSMMMDNGQGGTTTNALFAFVGGLEIAAVPEPSSLVLLGFGLMGVALRRSRP